MSVPRHKTAIKRAKFSRPVEVALRDGLITDETTVLDYGCGHGGDVRRMRQRGLDATGWDPVHAPDAVKTTVDVVNIGFVLNVIEHPQERAETLREAWSFASRVLVVAARLDIDARRQGDGVPHADGCITGIGTFQKFYEPSELRNFIDSTLEVDSVAAAPGVFVVFRDPAEREAYFASRFTRRIARPRLRRSDVLFEEHQLKLEPLMDFVAAHGRVPEVHELPSSDELVELFGSLPRAFALVRRVTGAEPWTAAKESRRQDLLVLLTLAAFPRRPKFSMLSDALQRDIRAAFGTYKKATFASDELLRDVGDLEVLRRVARLTPEGKKMPAAFYVHASALPDLPPLLRVYEGCARVLLGNDPDATLIKLSFAKPQVSYLHYPKFDRDPHPALESSTTVQLGSLRVRRRRFDANGNPPVLHRKELFVGDAYPGREKFARLTKQEEAWALFANPSEIGTRAGWLEVIDRTGLALRGHRLVRKPSHTSS